MNQNKVSNKLNQEPVLSPSKDNNRLILERYIGNWWKHVETETIYSTLESAIKEHVRKNGKSHLIIDQDLIYHHETE